MDKTRLLKYIEGDSTEEEKVEITRWLDADPENMREFLALHKLYDISIWQQMPEGQMKHEKTEIKQMPFSRSIGFKILKIAAIFLVAFIGTYYLNSISPKEQTASMQTIFVPSGQRAQITLVDGTKVWLNAGTTFSFPNQFNSRSREVRIDGEGFFEVSSDKKKPFIVQTGKFDIRVLGTKFDVMAYSSDKIFKTSLLEGSVEILKAGERSNGVLIKPEEQILLVGDKLVVGPMQHANYLLWKDGIISFDNESFAEIAKKLELYFDLKIDIENDRILDYRCTGKFRTKDGAEHILKVLQLRNKFSFSTDETRNIITIK